MLEFQQKRQVKKILYSRTTLVVLGLIIILLINSVWGVYKKRAISKENLDKAQASLDNLQAREETLSNEIERLKSTAGVEEEIREKFGLVKPGEEVIIVVDAENKLTVENIAENRNFWQKMIEWFK
ncbi:MAG: septum formation initiator family protein [Candidatus Paceibacterota bacterium]